MVGLNNGTLISAPGIDNIFQGLAAQTARQIIAEHFRRAPLLEGPRRILIGPAAYERDLGKALFEILDEKFRLVVEDDYLHGASRDSNMASTGPP